MSLKKLVKLANYYEGKYNLNKIAVPISSDYIEDIFSEPLRATIPATTNLLVYHGTCTNKLKDIISHGGLDPSKSAEGDTISLTKNQITQMIGLLESWSD